MTDPDPQPLPAPVAEAEHRRTHPITPLVTGWKVIAALLAAVSIQNIGSLLRDFTLTRLAIGLGVLAAVIVVAVVASALSWRFTTYAIIPEGVALRSGVLTRSRRFVPQEKIDSVSVERPLLARILGLAKVRVEVAGGSESHLDIAYVRTADADRLRREILQVTRADAPAGPADPAASAPPAAGTGAGTRGDPGAATAPPAPREGLWDTVVLDGVSDGVPIARIPTVRLVHSMVRDAEFLLGAAALVVGMLAAGALLLWDEGPGAGAILALIPALVAVPRLVLGRIEAGWGFVSRMTDRGLRMRRGLLNTRTDNVPPGRIQEITLARPLLWRGPGWTRATATVAGIGDGESEGSLTVLPVGTPEELRRTLGHLLPALGTPDDMAALERLLTARARELEGLRAPRRWQWISRRTEVVVLLPGVLVRRWGVLTRRVQLLARDRIQGVRVCEGPIARRCGLLDLTVPVAGASLDADGLARAEVLALREILERDAARLRRYRDRARWPRPAMSAPAATDPAAPAPAPAPAPATAPAPSPGPGPAAAPAPSDPIPPEEPR